MEKQTKPQHIPTIIYSLGRGPSTPSMVDSLGISFGQCYYRNGFPMRIGDIVLWRNNKYDI